jgi:tetratricopeptide (TPR) repeat protein
MVTRAVSNAALTLALAAAFTGCAGNTALDRGVALYRTGHYAQAQDTFDTIVRRQPDSVAAYVDRGAARIRLGDVSGALADYTRAAELSPLDPDIYYNRGNAYVRLAKPAEAIADYSRAIALRPDHAAAYFNRGTVRTQTGDPLAGRADWNYAAAIERDPDTRTAMLLSTGSVAIAAAPVVSSDAVSASPPMLSSVPAPTATVLSAIDTRALAARGVAREIDGDREGARADLQAALDLEPDPARRATIARLLRSLDAPR